MPTPNNIIAIRKRYGLNQTQAGALVHVSLRTWQRWEWGETPIPESKWELFQIKLERLKNETTNEFIARHLIPICQNTERENHE